MDDNLFTNENEIKYPSLEDSIDVRVLNNNTKLLSEQKVDFSELNNVSRESTNYSIENTTNAISTKVDSLATASSLSTLNTTTNTINTNVSSLLTKTNTLATSTELEVVSNKIDNIGSGEEKQKWWDLPNIYTKKILANLTSKGFYHYPLNIYRLSTAGKLISISAPFRITLPPSVDSVLTFILTLDSDIIINTSINVIASTISTEDFYIGFGVHNIQSGCPFNDYSSHHNVSNILSMTDDTGTKTESTLNDSNIDQTYLNTTINSYPNFHTNVNTNHITPLELTSELQSHTISIYNQKSTYGYPQANSFIHFYDDTCLKFSSKLNLQLSITSTSWDTNILSGNHGSFSIGLAT